MQHLSKKMSMLKCSNVGLRYYVGTLKETALDFHNYFYFTILLLNILSIVKIIPINVQYNFV